MLNEILNALSNDIKQILLSWGVTNEEVFFEIPKEENHGDYAVNIAMRLARVLRKSPQIIATDIVERIDLKKHHLDKCEVAGPGFINFYLDRDYLANIVFKINALNSDYGNLSLGNEKVNIEFVSANPTGYLHIGHGRSAAYGDSLARILKKAGYEVTKEHYVNDAGNQINNLANSIYQRYRQLYNLDFEMLEGYYHGKEIIEIAKMIKEDKKDYYLSHPWFDDFRKFGVDYLLNGLKKDLHDFNVEFDIWFSEKSLYANGEVEKTLQYLIDHNCTYEKEGAIWLKTTAYNDEKDRVLVKSDKSLTYLTPDIAYHKNKFSRGYDRLIDVLGADHHGYIDRLKAALTCVGEDSSKLEIEILQMVRVIQDGQEIKMSKRSGKAITLRDLIDEVGTDPIRFMYTSKALSSPMDLDLDLAIKETNENPIYYVQYAYARICSLFRMLEEKNIKFVEVKSFKKLDISKCDKIIMTLLQYPSVIEEAAIKRIPHRICQYTLQLATVLHSYYNDEKIISEDIDETNEKMTLLKSVQIVLKDSLNLIGVGVKEKM